MEFLWFFNVYCKRSPLFIFNTANIQTVVVIALLLAWSKCATLHKNIEFNLLIISFCKWVRLAQISVCVIQCHPLHYYVLWIPCKVGRCRWVWSIFNSCTAWTDHITCMCNCLCSVIVLCEVVMMKGREKVKPGAGSQPALLEKHQGGRQA